ncbi:sulfotransferase family protein [Xanthomonas campestris pv. phormiicola]|nr:sulfotransferase family protein [Xanthomonas campestris pv. phormiicola]UYC17054.1 sulfotransferase family protein [Xanthomonas campestris pv. phormiicola]
MQQNTNLRGVENQLESLYYLHIPKTAGTSLIAFLDAQFADTEICPGQLLPSLFSIDRTRLRDYRFFRGHLWHGLERYVGQPLRYLTMLRDPLHRTLSWYSHVRRDPNAHRHEQVVGEQWSLLEFVTDPETQWDLINTQTIFLAADLDFEQLAADPVGYGTRTIRAYAKRGDDPALLEAAKRRLESMEFGIAERMADSLNLFSHVFGFDPAMPAQHLNVSARHISESEISADVRSAVDKVTVLDRELYDWARARFAERFSAMVRSLVMNEARREGRAGRVWRLPLQPSSHEYIGVEVLECPRSLSPDALAMVDVAIRNDSEELLSSRPPHPIHVSYHWVDTDGEMIVYDGERSQLPKPLGAGERFGMTVRVRAPVQEGRFNLQVRLVQEGVSWIEGVQRPQNLEVLVSSN